jgi:methylglutaconyl-CoA hydratase
MPFAHLLVERDGPIERLTLNRPEVRNAFNDQVIAELTAWAEGVGTDASVRVVVLAGAGPSFCAGADAAWMAASVDRTRDENVRDAAAASRMFAAIDRLPVAVIGRVQGAALGGGAGLAAVCDIVVAEERAVFGFTEVKLGILPAVISPFVLAKIGRSAARELFLSGARFSAARAREIRLVHGVVPAARLDAEVAAYVAELLTASPAAIAAAKALIGQVSERTLDAAMELTADALAAQRVSAQGQEGLRAFLQKRRPSWIA